MFFVTLYTRAFSRVSDSILYSVSFRSYVVTERIVENALFVLKRAEVHSFIGHSEGVLIFSVN